MSKPTPQTEQSDKVWQRLKDKIQDDKKLQAELAKEHPKYFSHLKPAQ